MKRSIVKNPARLAVAALLAFSATPTRADAGGHVEIGVGTAYTRGLGSPSGPMPALEHLAGGGGALRLDAGWRIDRRWRIGCYHEGSVLAAGHGGGGAAKGAAAGLEGQLHLAPLAALDPWVGVGFGWRGLWLDHGAGTHALQGLDLARIQVGVDYRISPLLSVAPTVGVSLTEFVAERLPGGAWASIDDRELSAFVFAGISGRMGLPGGRTGR